MKKEITIGELKETIQTTIKLTQILVKEIINDVLSEYSGDYFYYKEIFISKYYDEYESHNMVNYNTKKIIDDLRILLFGENKYTEKKYNTFSYENSEKIKNFTQLSNIKFIYQKKEYEILLKRDYISTKYNTNDENYYLTNDFMKLIDESKILDITNIDQEKIQLSLNNYFKYKSLKKHIKDHEALLIENESLPKFNNKDKIKLENNDFFDKDGNIKSFYLNTDLLKHYNLKNIDFDNKNISGLNISKNPEVYINFYKIIKDLTNSNISGYNLEHYTFKYYNLTDCNLSNTHATIDLATCAISLESKISTGTIFDENNKFIFGNKVLAPEEVEHLGIKVKKLSN